MPHLPAAPRHCTLIYIQALALPALPSPQRPRARAAGIHWEEYAHGLPLPGEGSCRSFVPPQTRQGGMRSPWLALQHLATAAGASIRPACMACLPGGMKSKLARRRLTLFLLGCAHPPQTFGRIMAPPLLTKLDDPKEQGLQVRCRRKARLLHDAGCGLLCRTHWLPSRAVSTVLGAAGAAE